jgi:iron complex transport system substrate-binding protein
MLAAAAPGSAEPASLRLVSLNPSLSAILVRLDAAGTLVGIDDYTARVIPELADRPRVGGLFDPNLEAVVALRPDRVLIVAGVDQEAHAQRLERLGLVVEVYANERFDEVLDNIARLGRLVGRSAAAQQRIAAIRAMRAAVTRATRERPSPASVAVVDRSPLFLVGGDTFLDEMLEAVGARNLVRALGDGYPRGSLEWLIAARPELLLDMTPGGEDAQAFWSRWPSLPAVSQGRVLALEARRLSMPGPDLDAALRELAMRVHGADIDAQIEAALAATGPAPPSGSPAPAVAEGEVMR